MKRNILFVLIAAFVCVICLVPEEAGAGYTIGKITQVGVVQGANGEATVGLIYFEKGLHQNAPTCATEEDRYAVDLNTAAGRAIYTTAMAAWLSGTCAHVIGAEGPQGTPNCKLWGDTETGYWIFNCPR